MSRIGHGTVIKVSTVQVARAAVAASGEPIANAFVAGAPGDLQRFDYLFGALQNDPAMLLEVGQKTRDDLVRLGKTMQESGPAMDDPAGDSGIPAAYTYLGQFIDHDVTLEAASADLPDLLSLGLQPFSLADARALLKNARTGTLDLDSVYGVPAPRFGNDLIVGKVSETGSSVSPKARPPGKSDDNDLPREPRNADSTRDRAALIGDPRNDENTIVSQLHTAFLRAHNAIVETGKTFDEARTILRQHYQHIVIHDFLKRIVDPTVVNDILQNGNKLYDAMLEPFFLPLEFSGAAYRFGHTMIRGNYNFNLNFNRRPGGIPASLDLLFTFSALSGQLGFPDNDFDTLPENWIIEWPEVLGLKAEKARKLDTRLVEPLFALRTVTGAPELGDGARLAVRNLLRGYLLRMPTGQAVASAMGVAPLTPAEIEAVAATVPAAPGQESQLTVIVDSGFTKRTPLWYYVLAEAAAQGRGERLGRVGGTLVAEVLIGLVRRSEDSILRTPGWVPTLRSATPGLFELADLLTVARVL